MACTYPGCENPERVEADGWDLTHLEHPRGPAFCDEWWCHPYQEETPMPEPSRLIRVTSAKVEAIVQTDTKNRVGLAWNKGDPLPAPGTPVLVVENMEDGWEIIGPQQAAILRAARRLVNADGRPSVGPFADALMLLNEVVKVEKEGK